MVSKESHGFLECILLALATNQNSTNNLFPVLELQAQGVF